MGHCVEFGTTITEGCDHPMVAAGHCCVCDVCGTRCPGRFAGCPDVWARGPLTAALVPPRDEPAVAPIVADSALSDLFPAHPVRSGSTGTLDREPPIEWPTSILPVPLRTHQSGGVPAERAKHPGSAGRRRRRFTAATVAVLVAGALLGRMLVTGSNDTSPAVAVAATPPELRFATVTVANGVTGQRVWRIEGGHRFIGTLAFTNASAAPVAITYDERLPKTLASNVSVVLFTPEPSIVQSDPVVRYAFDVPANTTVTVTYEVAVPPTGSDYARLEQWARDAQAELAQRVKDAQDALARAQNAAQAAAAQAVLNAARAAQRAFKPKPPPRDAPPGCGYCQIDGGGGASTSPSDPGSTTPSSDTTSSTDPAATTSTDAPTTTTTPPCDPAIDPTCGTTTSPT